MRNAKRLLKKMLSLTLSAAMLAEGLPLQAMAQEQQEIRLEGVEIPEDVLAGDFFYLGSTKASIPENGNGTYLLRVARGGDALSEAVSLVRIADLTARYGEDYTISVRGSRERVDNPRDNQSLAEMISGTDFTQSELADEETATAALAEDEEGQKVLQEGVEAAVDFLTSESGLAEKYPEGPGDLMAQVESGDGEIQPEDGINTRSQTASDGPDAAEGAEGISGEKGKEPEAAPDSLQQGGKDAESAGTDAVRMEDGSEIITVGETEEENPLDKARAMFTGVEGGTQRLTSNASEAQAYQDLQSIADVMTSVVVGASVELTFREGEKEKFLEITPKNNAESDGDRMFYLILGAPQGSTTNSAVSTCAVTIVDDEESVPAIVSFSEETYTPAPGGEQVTVTVTRTGAVNKVVSTRVRTTGDGSAMAGRDYAEVDRELLFPFGVESLTVEIPVRTSLFVGDKDFGLELIPQAGCKAGLGQSRVLLAGTWSEASVETDSLEEGDGEEALSTVTAVVQENTLATVKTLGSISLQEPLYKGNSSSSMESQVSEESGKTLSLFKGHNEYDRDNKRWKMDWKKTYTIGSEDLCNVSVTWKLTDDPAPYWIAGAQVTWDRTKKHADMKVEISGEDHRWYSHFNMVPWKSNLYLCNNTGSFSLETQNMYPSINESADISSARPNYIHFVNHGNCSDCNYLYIYDIKPILRPFQIKYKAYDKLTYLNEEGRQIPDTDVAPAAGIVGAQNNQMILHLNESFTVQQTSGPSIPKYAEIKGLELSPDGKHWFSLDLKPVGGKDITCVLDKDTISSYVSMMGEQLFYNSLKENKFISPYYYSLPQYAEWYVRPVFDKIPVPVVLSNPYDVPVTITISKRDYELAPGETRKVEDFYRGDKLYTRVSLDSSAASLYTAAGISIDRKTDESKDPVHGTLSFTDGKPVYISGNNDDRLNYTELTIEPMLQDKGNRILLRVRTDELDRFNRETGILAGSGTVNGEWTEFLYADSEQTVYGRMYPVTVIPAGEDTVCRWYDSTTRRSYEGNTLYFTAGDTPAKNVITLSAVDKKYDVRLSGTLRYMNYDLYTKTSGSTSAIPAGGAVVAAASASATADENGAFRTGPIPVCGSSDGQQVFLRYMVYVNGKPVVREVCLDSSRSEIDVSAAFENGVSPVSSDIFNGLNISGEYNASSGYTILDGNCLQISDADRVTMTIRIKPAPYKVSADGASAEEERLETPKKLQLLVYDPKNNKIRGKYEPVEGKYDSFANYYTFQSIVYFSQDSKDKPLDNFTVMPGDLLYLRLETDRMTMQDEDGNSYNYTYSDLYTGFTFIYPTADKAPITQGITSPVSISYKDIPFLGDSGMKLDFPFGTVGYIKTDRGYRMYIGASAAQIFSKISETHLSNFCGDDGQYWGDLFSAKEPIESFKNGLQKAQDLAFSGTDKIAAALKDGSLGHPTWKFDLMVGIYFDFELPVVTESGTGNVECPDFLFAGIGAFVSVTLGFKATWYYIVPVVFIPIYIGIELEGTVLGFLGATTSGEKSITLDDSQSGTVEFDKALNKFTGAVHGTAKVQLNVGVGLCGVIGVRAYGTVETIATYTPSDIVRDWGVYLTLDAGVDVDLFLTSVGYSAKLYDKRWGCFEDYQEREKDEQVDINTDSVLAADSPEVDDPFSFREGSGIDSVWYGATIGIGGEAASGMRGGEEAAPDSAFAPKSTRILLENAYERPDSQLITLQNGTVVLAYIDSDESKGKYQRTTLKLASMKDGAWSDPVPVAVDNTADFQPSIAEMKDGRILVAWVSTGSDDITEETGTVDYLSSMEIYASIAEVSESGSIRMGEQVKITNDHRERTENGVTKTVGYYDCNPTVVCDMVSGDAMVYYIKSGRVSGSAVDLANPYTNDSRVCYMPYSASGVQVARDGSTVTEHWLFDYFYEGEIKADSEEARRSSEQWLIREFGGQRFLDSPTMTENNETVYYSIPDFTAIGYNGYAVYAFSVDHDGSMDTDADRELFLQVYSFTEHKTRYLIRLTDDQIADTMPQLFRSKMVSSGAEGTVDDATDTRLFWYRGGKEISYIDVSRLIREGIHDDGTLKYFADGEETTAGEEGAETLAEPLYVSTPVKDSHAAGQMADFRVTEDDRGSLYILWTEGAGDAREIFATSLLSTTGDEEDNAGCPSWSGPYQLTRDGYYNDELAVTLSGDELIVVHNRFRQAFNLDEDGNINSSDPIRVYDMTLAATVLEPCGAVSTEDLTLVLPVEGEPGNAVKLPMGGSTVDILVELINRGLTVAKGYRATLYAVDKNGGETEIGVQEVTETLAPTCRNTLRFAGYTLPADVEGLAFKVVTEELREGSVYYSRNEDNLYLSEALAMRGDYSFNNLVTYQLPDGFHLAGAVSNNGNAAAAQDDVISVVLNGPYNMELSYDREARVLARIPLDGLKPGETRTFDAPVSISAGMMKEYSYITASVAVGHDSVFTPVEGEAYHTVDTVVLGKSETVCFEMTMPLGFRAVPVCINTGDLASPVVTDMQGTSYDETGLIFSVDDTSVAEVRNGRILGVTPGKTTLNVTHAASGVVITAPVIVGGDVPAEDIPEDSDIPEDLWYVVTGGKNVYTYTGKKITPEVRVYDNTKLLVKGRDYTVSYANNVNIGSGVAGESGFDAAKAPRITIRGIGNYVHEESIYFTIAPAELTDDRDVYAEDVAIAYKKGKALAVKPVVEWKGKKLKADRDYTFTIRRKDENKAVDAVQELGEYDLFLTGKGNFTGTRKLSLTVYDKEKCKPVSALTVGKIKDEAYTGSAVEPKLTVKNRKTELTAKGPETNSYQQSEDYDYSVRYLNNVDAGRACAIIQGNPARGYVGTRRVWFRIAGKSLKGAALTGLKKEGYEYAGDAVTLDQYLTDGTLTLTAKGGTLITPATGREKGAHYSYTVSYAKNTKPGTATIIFTGTGGCTDSVRKTFKIAKGSISSDAVSVSLAEAAAPYAKSGAKARVNVMAGGRKLIEGTDYTLSYKNNKKIGGTATVIVKGKGSYAGERRLDYMVDAGDLSALTLSAQDVLFAEKAGNFLTKFTITEEDGKKLSAGRDYDKAVAYTWAEDGENHRAGDTVSDNDVVPAGSTLCVTAKASGNSYRGSVSGSFRVTQKSLDRVKLSGKIADQSYTGKEVTLRPEDIPMEVPAAVERDGITVYNWEIIEDSYKKNIRKGTASVTLRGLGEYGGTKTVTFKIVSKEFNWEAE